MSLYDRIKALCDEHKIAVTKLEAELGFARAPSVPSKLGKPLKFGH